MEELCTAKSNDGMWTKVAAWCLEFTAIKTLRQTLLCVVLGSLLESWSFLGHKAHAPQLTCSWRWAENPDINPFTNQLCLLLLISRFQSCLCYSCSSSYQEKVSVHESVSYSSQTDQSCQVWQQFTATTTTIIEPSKNLLK